MKKTIIALTVLASITIFAACHSSKKAANPTDDSSKKSIYGTWTLTGITLADIPDDKFAVTVLGRIPRKCMINSVWTFPYNGYGTYTITQQSTDCPTGGQNILWSRLVDNGVPYLQFKELEQGVKDKKITSGFKYEIVTQNAADMILRSPVNIAGRNTYVVYSFAKNQ